MKHLLTVIAASTLITPLGWCATGSEKVLYQDSIQATKQSIAQDTLEIFYHDAQDNYDEGRYDEALQLLDKISAINPRYKDSDKLRSAIQKKMQSNQTAENKGTIREWMKKGDFALRNDEKAAAIAAWKQALAIDPDYAPAKKKIQDLHKVMAKKEFEDGYIHNQHGELEDALESWSNAIALDPSYKQKGLLLLMSKIRLQVKDSRIKRLEVQGKDQYQQGNLEDAILSYNEILLLSPRHEEARRMSNKIKLLLGQAALEKAQIAMTKQAYPEAIDQADKALQYDYERASAQNLKAEAQRALKAGPKKPAKKSSPKPPPPPKEAPAPVPTSPENAQEAMTHYRRGLAAIRNKDYHLAIQELDSAAQLDPANERIYISRERAKQEWSNAQAGGVTP